MPWLPRKPRKSRKAEANQGHAHAKACDNRTMPRTVKARFGKSELSQAPGAVGPSGKPPPPVPLYQHPVVGCSLVLMASTAAQAIVWMITLRLPSSLPANPSSLVSHGLVFRLLADLLGSHLSDSSQFNAFLAHASLVAAILSGIAWYAVAHLGLGPKWGLWVGLLWVLHPSFAFLANQASDLNLLSTLLPTSLCVLLCWHRSRKPSRAVVTGCLAAVTCLVGLQGLIVLVISLLAMLMAARGQARRFIGAVSLVLGFSVCSMGLLATLAAIRVFPGVLHEPKPLPSLPDSHTATTSNYAALGATAGRSLPRLDALRLTTATRFLACRLKLEEDLTTALARMDADLWMVFDDASGSPMAAAARAWAPQEVKSRPPAITFAVQQFRESPAISTKWLAGRFHRSIYATSDGHTYYPLVVLHFVGLIPAIWGLWIALRYRPWRWLAVIGGLLAASHWFLTALGEPLARNLTPIGGLAVMFALVGVTDIYERLFGRRLTAPAPASKPARLRRMRRNVDEETSD